MRRSIRYRAMGEWFVCGLLMAFRCTPLAAQAPPQPPATAKVTCYQDAPEPLRIACKRLGDWIGEKGGSAGIVNVGLFETPDEELGDQGFAVESDPARGISIRGNTAVGATNGAYTVLRELMIASEKDPFSRAWSLRDKPHFSRREIWLPSYPQQIMRVTPAAWRLVDWKRYLDYLRLLNVTQIGVGTSDLYNPLEPASAHNRQLWETWREAARYAHRLGMKFCISFQFNQTPLEYWWKYPDKRVVYRGGYTQAIGNGLCWSRGKEEIVALWPFMFDFFKEVDAVQIFFNDYGSLCMCDECLEDPAGRALEAVKIAKEAWKKANPDGEFYFWSWVFEWYDLPHFKPLVEGVQRKRPSMKTILEEMPRDLVWVDPNSALYKQISGTLTEPDGLLAAKKAGFDPIVKFVYLTGVEAAPEPPPPFKDIWGAFHGNFNQLPFPNINASVGEIRYTKAEQAPQGIMAYRLAPFHQAVGDYVFMRSAWNPDLTPDQLAGEAAGFLVSNPSNRAKMKEAVLTLEQFWGDIRSDTIAKSKRLLDEIKQSESGSGWWFDHTYDGVWLLSLVANYEDFIRTEPSEEDRNEMREEIVKQTWQMHSYRHYTTETLNYLGPLRRKIDYWAGSLKIRRARMGATAIPAEEAKSADDQ